MSIYIFAEKGDKPEITVVRTDSMEGAKKLAGITTEDYQFKMLADYDLDTLKTNNEVLIR